MKRRLPWLAFAAATLVMGPGCGHDCVLIDQTVFVPSADPQLAALVDDCWKGKATTSGTCQGDISCACLPLCKHALMLIDGFPGPEDLKSCVLHSPGSASDASVSADGGVSSSEGSVVISLSYRPSQCHEQAQ